MIVYDIELVLQENSIFQKVDYLQNQEPISCSNHKSYNSLIKYTKEPIQLVNLSN